MGEKSRKRKREGKIVRKSGMVEGLMIDKHVEVFEFLPC